MEQQNYIKDCYVLLCDAEALRNSSEKQDKLDKCIKKMLEYISTIGIHEALLTGMAQIFCEICEKKIEILGKQR